MLAAENKPFPIPTAMALPLSKPVILPLAEERRRHQRVKVNLLGRYMLADRREFPCQVVDMSPGGMALQAPMAGQPGERVIAYVDHLGRLEGKVARTFENGFAMTISATLRKRDKLAAQLTWLANRQISTFQRIAATAGLRRATQWRASCCPMAPMSPAA